MLKRFRRHLNPPMVVATIALFAALGGGYALAFSGSGSLQKGYYLFPTAGSSNSPVPVRTLTGTGQIEAYCEQFAPTTSFVHWRLHNSSGKQLALRGVESDLINGATTQNNISEAVNNGQNSEFHKNGEFIGHIAPINAGKTPQVSIDIGFNNGDVCSNSSINVLALNTQEP